MSWTNIPKPTAQSYTNVAKPSSGVFGTEIITNGGFDTNLNGWTYGISWDWQSGRAHLKYPNNTESLGQAITLSLGVTYRVSFDWEIPNGVVGNTFFAGFDTTGHNVTLNANGDITGTYSYDLTTILDDVNVGIFFIQPDFTFEMYVNNVSVKQLISTSSWTNIAKPTGNILANIPAGRATGMIMPPTYSSSILVIGSKWTNINKPT